MRRLVCFVLAALAVAPSIAFAQMQPHRAEYALRLGTAANAPRIGTAVQDLTQDCAGWRLKRDILERIRETSGMKTDLEQLQRLSGAVTEAA